MTGFQSKVNAFPAPGVPGDFATLNPLSSVVAGQGALTAGVSAIAGLFHWVSSTGTIESNCPTTLLTVPQGILGNVGNALITVWLGQASMQVQQGYAATLYDRGDFFVSNAFAPASYGNKVFVNKRGQVTAGAAGAFVTTDASSTGAISSGHIDNGSVNGTTGNVLTVVTGSGLEVGLTLSDAVTGAFIGTITSLGTGTGGAGTYNLNQNAAYPAASAFTVTGLAVSGATGTASFATSVMTVTGTTTGTFAVGQFIQSADVAAGTYVTSLGTYDGSTGTLNLSTSPGTITEQDASGSGWIETPWSFKNTTNAGDLAIVGILN